MQLDAFWVNVGVLIACLPSAGNIYVLAQRHDADAQQITAQTTTHRWVPSI